MPLARVKQAISPYPDLQVILFEASTHTAELAAQALGVAVGQIAKSLVFLADNSPLLVVTCGDKKVNTKLLAKAVGAKKIKFADAALVATLTGFPPGGVSPLGLDQAIPVYLDASLYDYDVVYAAAGTANSALPVIPERLREITAAQVINVCQ
ncbi:MAG: YbaK/EbsC family protein [Negativicutes bacterium]|nr:YbaK/EbsC family protein [Negativicutes bacterium]